MGSFKRLLTAALLGAASLSHAIEPARKPHQPTGNSERLLTFNETSPSATIKPKSQTIKWTSAGGDGSHIATNDAGDLVLEDIVTGDSETFFPGDKLPEGMHEYWISSDAKRLLVAANYTKQYRHSYFANYFILDVESGESTPLVEDQDGDIQYAELAPTGDQIAFVRGNNLYIRDHASGDVTQVTDDGGPDMFHGVTDWVYEEEIFGGTSALWFSPDAKFIAFVSSNETGVGTFTIPYYMDNQDLAPTYPKELELRYPKVGSKNPTVQLNVLDLGTGEYEKVVIDAFDPEDVIFGEMAWVTDTHTALIYRAFNRVQDCDAHVLVDPTSFTSKTVRERDGSDGWLDNSLAIQYVGALESHGNQSYYLDLSDESGWVHIYLYPVDGGEPVQVTSGEWEVASILNVDAAQGLISYVAASHHSTERHIYTVSLKDNKTTPLVDDEVAAYWSASFSSGGGFYVLNYQGPDVPYQELYASTDTTTPIRTIEDNADFIETISEYNLPIITYFDLEHPDGYTLSVMQQLPPNFDPAKKYPVLFTPYGGPNSQEVTKTHRPLDWEAYISSETELQYVVYKVDNRGTGFRGREYRSFVAGQLGKLEPRDQVWAAEKLVKENTFLDGDRVGMWGWSYGGYLTAKTLE
ncbi:S9 family peptidase, partial [Candidatus Bathyarchaeota archaeon]|nr:S9 family peptidase [Candidatus Bathyarchaeota archaeon]